MTNIICATDPISMRPLHMLPAFEKLPSIKDCKGDYCLSIFFESRKNLKKYKKIRVEPSTLDLMSNLDDWVDEG
ncbi:MAG: hypothetical protein HQL55_03780 [Magnetococcales bacterium]|nr:hypothetical protein [Magnetococcales bacterium]